MQKRKTITVPESIARVPRVLVAWIGRGDRELRDVTQPVGYDEHGNALYGPRGIISHGDTLEEAMRNLPRPRQ
jgi:hypothetical protein